jgi:hypothetical protein
MPTEEDFYGSIFHARTQTHTHTHTHAHTHAHTHTRTHTYAHIFTHSDKEQLIEEQKKRKEEKRREKKTKEKKRKRYALVSVCRGADGREQAALRGWLLRQWIS